VQSHGWCRNPDYEGRDDTVLLRASELACRGGWNLDSWQEGTNGALMELVAANGSGGETSGALPIGQGIGSLAATDAGVNAAKAALVAARPGGSVFPPGRRRAPQPAAAGGMTAIVASRGGQDAVSVIAPSLQNHPELGPSGEVIRRPSRSDVAEAHRKALERRENEREEVERRRREQQAAALESLYASSKPTNGSDAVTTPPRAPEARPTPPLQTTSPTGSGSIGNSLSQLTMPRAASIPAASPESEDRQVMPERPMQPVETLGMGVRQDSSMLPPATPLGSNLAPTPATRLPEPVVPSVRDLPTETSQARYWDDPQGGTRPSRMVRPEPTEAPPVRHAPLPVAAQAVANVGRPRVEELLPVEPAPTGRTIRTMAQRDAGLAADPERVPTQPAPRLSRPVAAAEQRPTEPATPVLPPRQIDEQLLQRLQQDWRERTMAAYAGQRCGTCRYFQAQADASQGSCACQFAVSYRQAQGRQDLGCINAFGTWWVANDDGWLQKADLGQRQPTPMVDQLLKEWGIPDAPPAATERRREAR
jgi:hypothetical protein